MRGIYLGESNPLECIKGRDYEVIGYNAALDSYAVVDEVGASYGVGYLYATEEFEIIDDGPFRTDLEEQHAIIYQYAIREGFAGVWFLRRWKNRDIYEMVSHEYMNTGKPEECPTLVGYDGAVIEKIEGAEYEDFIRRFWVY